MRATRSWASEILITHKRVFNYPRLVFGKRCVDVPVPDNPPAPISYGMPLLHLLASASRRKPQYFGGVRLYKWSCCPTRRLGNKVHHALRFLACLGSEGSGLSVESAEGTTSLSRCLEGYFSGVDRLGNSHLRVTQVQEHSMDQINGLVHDAPHVIMDALNCPPEPNDQPSICSLSK